MHSTCNRTRFRHHRRQLHTACHNFRWCKKCRGTNLNPPGEGSGTDSSHTTAKTGDGTLFAATPTSDVEGGESCFPPATEKEADESVNSGPGGDSTEKASETADEIGKPSSSPKDVSLLEPSTKTCAGGDSGATAARKGLEWNDSSRKGILSLSQTMLRNRKVLPQLHLPSSDMHDAAASSLLPLDLCMKTVDRDCHCLFKALIVCMATSQLSHWDVRKQIVDYVLTHWDDPENEFTKIIRMDNDKETPLSYQERMLGGRKDWGGFPELMAAARVFGTHVVVFHYVHGDETLQSTFVSAPNLDFDDPPTIHLVRVQDKQYHAALRVGNTTSKDAETTLTLNQARVAAPVKPVARTTPQYAPPPGSPGFEATREDSERRSLASFFATIPLGSTAKQNEARRSSPETTSGQSPAEVNAQSSMSEPQSSEEKKQGKKRQYVAAMFGSTDNNKRACEDNDFDDDDNGGNGEDDSDLSSNDLDLPAKKKRVRNRSN